VLLIRDPFDMLPSLTIQLPDATLADTGLARQVALLNRLLELDNPPQVLDSQQLLLDPAGVLATLCDAINIDWTPKMLRWAAGPRPEDGIWAKHWYHAVHRSTGFAAYQPKTGFPEHLRPLLAECEPCYATLFEHAIRARPKQRTSG
jgi:hypothetical protein